MRRATKRNTQRPSKRFGLTLKFGFGLIVVFMLVFLGLANSARVKDLLLEQQRLRNEGERLSEENKKLELEIAKLSSLDNLRRTISDAEFGFPPPEDVKLFHWEQKDTTKANFFDRASDFVMNWIKRTLDVKGPIYADSLRKK